jgi:hypothetical protein
MSSTFSSDFAPWEFGAAVIIAVAVQLGSGVGLYLARAQPPADLNEVDKNREQPVRVMPVLDEEAFAAAKAGGKKAVLPDMWQRAPTSVKKAIQEKPAPPPDVAAPSPKAGLEASAAPDKTKKTETVEDAGTETDASTEGADAGQPDSDADAGPATLDSDGGKANGNGEEGCLGEGCTKDGKNADIQAAQYQARLISFFKRGFTVSGLGLPAEDIAKLAVSVSVSLSGDGVVQSFTMSSSGNATFDSAARASLQGKVGQQVPNPPEDRPELSRTSLGFSMVCSKSCN